jgi:hypothetical protein
VHAAERLIEGLIVAGLVYVVDQFLSGMPFHSALANAPFVRQPFWEELACFRASLMKALTST